MYSTCTQLCSKKPAMITEYAWNFNRHAFSSKQNYSFMCLAQPGVPLVYLKYIVNRRAHWFFSTSHREWQKEIISVTLWRVYCSHLHLFQRDSISLYRIAQIIQSAICMLIVWKSACVCVCKQQHIHRCRHQSTAGAQTASS